MMKYGRKNSPRILFFALAIFVSAGQMTAGDDSPVFDVRKVPFSLSKSSLSVCQNRKSRCLSLTDVRFALFGRKNEILRLLYMSGSDVVQPQASATPGMLSLSTGTKVFGRACYESKEIFRLKGGDYPLVLGLDEQMVESGGIRVLPQDGNRFFIESTNRFGVACHILSCLDGDLKYESDKCRFRLMSSSNNTYEISVEESDGSWKSNGTKKSFDDCAASAQRDYDEFLSKIPALPERYGKSRELAAYVLWSCMIDKGGNYQRPAMLMSKNWMHYIWSWDHCFNAMACSYGLPGMAWDNFLTVFDIQDADGRLPDVLGYARLDWSVIKPPIHGWAFRNMRNNMQMTDAQLRDGYACLKRLTDYWFKHRDSNTNGIPEYIQANDCWDNGTEFNIKGDPNFIANRESANLSAYLVLQMDELRDLALLLGDKDAADSWKKKSDHVLAHLLDKLWDGSRFLTVNVADGSINKESRSSMRFLPFVLGDKLPSGMRSKMIKDLKEGGYLTEWGVATESVNSKLYSDDGYWTGPIWAPTTLIMVDGLWRAGERDLAKEIAQKFCDMCVKSGFAENFDAKTGKGLRDPAYTWTASVFLILGHEYLK